MKQKGLAIIGISILVGLASYWARQRAEKKEELRHNQTLERVIEATVKEVLGGKSGALIEETSKSTTVARNHHEERMGDALTIRQKVLLSASERSKLDEYFSDPSLYQFAASVISNHAEQKQRMMATDYLVKALNWPGNRSLGALLQQYEEVLALEDIKPEMSLEQKRSLAADRMELFAHYYDLHTERAQQFLDRSSPSNQKVMKFAINLMVRK